MILSGFLAMWLAAAPDTGAGYAVERTAAAPEALLAGDAQAWATSAAITWGPSEYATTFRALWSGDGLFVRWDAADPRPWHTRTSRDAALFNEEVVEIFLDLDRSGTHYAEVEINPANAVCDLHVLRPLPAKPGDPPWKGDFSWNVDGIETRVTIDRGAKAIHGWSAFARIPWSGLKSLPSAAAVTLPPQPGDRWRFNVFRIERPHGPEEPDRDVVLAAWSPADIPKFHVASTFRDFQFR